MWLILGILSVIGGAAYFRLVPTLSDISTSVKHVYSTIIEVCKVIRRNGIGTCLVWTNQVITNQICNQLVEMHHKYYVIQYPYGVSWYKIIVPRHRGPCKIDTIVDSTGTDVKKDIMMYMGPSHNFHGTTITPTMMGYEQLTFTYLNGTVKTFENNDIVMI